ncbi:hypothetical protein HHK36_026134 [Tetracentron sinense]|uniref:Uncharacterized protein n=1 Tax=Tetracentron sinense TaxID=13715 RepID=A0A834YIM8_TETSI|nr:hypothetical protein HHK36_026134 [Tetracentron sinense]
MKDPRSLLESLEVGSRVHEKNLVEEMRELRKLRTAIMMEKCQSKNEVVMCPKPRKRQCGELTDQKLGAELSDIIISKASPPYYAVSPPVRASNPLIKDVRFHEQRVSQSPVLGFLIEGLDTVVDRTRRTQSIPTMA